MEFEVDRFAWVPGPREFRLLLDEDVLVDVAPLRPDVHRQRLRDGWNLVSTKPATENAQDLVLDLWTRAARGEI